jgi:hypothetical protein
MPNFYWASQFVESGGLMSYGENLRATYRATAAYMDTIKRGAKPANLAVEQSYPLRAGNQHEDREDARSHGPTGAADAGGTT